MTVLPPPVAPSFLRAVPVELSFGTSGLRGLVRHMTDLEVGINVLGFLRYLLDRGDLYPGEPVAVARDLRETDPTTGLSSSPRITRAVAWAIQHAVVQGPALTVFNAGCVPTPTLAAYAMAHGMVSVMVTGSHIPADRNGVKFYKKSGEILKADEPGILTAVRAVRTLEYARTATDTDFDADGLLRAPPTLPAVSSAPVEAYRARYLDLFPGQRPLQGMHLVFYQHSAVGRDLLVEILQALGATVTAVDRSDVFVPVDTEEVRPADVARFRALAAAHHPDAIVSTDGDSDRPFVVDEHGTFHRGDALGIVVADYLQARFAAVPVSTTDALDRFVAARPDGLRVQHTRIGSPYVIAAMDEAMARGVKGVVGWEANGGFLTGTEVPVNGHPLSPLPTRDALLPMLCALLAARARGLTVSGLFATLPQRATAAGLIDDFPVDVSRAIMARLKPPVEGVTRVDYTPDGPVLSHDTETVPASDAQRAVCVAQQAALEAYFPPSHGYGRVQRVVSVDGIRVLFANGDIAHLRPSGNAPQMRIYAVSDTPARAEAIVEQGVHEPDGVLRAMERSVTHGSGVV